MCGKHLFASMRSVPGAVATGSHLSAPFEYRDPVATALGTDLISNRVLQSQREITSAVPE